MAVVVEPRPSRQDVLERAERREQLAATLYAGILASGQPGYEPHVEACNRADALIAELDRRRDAELQEARDA